MFPLVRVWSICGGGVVCFGVGCVVDYCLAIYVFFFASAMSSIVYILWYDCLDCVFGNRALQFVPRCLHGSYHPHNVVLFARAATTS